MVRGRLCFVNFGGSIEKVPDPIVKSLNSYIVLMNNFVLNNFV